MTRGRHKDFQQCVEPLLPQSAAYAYAIVRSREDAEDAVQEAAIKAYQAFARYNPSCPFKEEVRRAIVEDQRLRRIYEQMAETDSALSSFAAACQFEPHVSLPSISPVLGFPIYAVAFSLLIVRILAKVLPFGPGIWLQALMIALVAAWLLYRFLPILRAEMWQAVHELGLNQRAV